VPCAAFTKSCRGHSGLYVALFEEIKRASSAIIAKSLTIVTKCREQIVQLFVFYVKNALLARFLSLGGVFHR
jgi:hypothetical protein